MVSASPDFPSAVILLWFKAHRASRGRSRSAFPCVRLLENQDCFMVRLIPVLLLLMLPLTAQESPVDQPRPWPREFKSKAVRFEVTKDRRTGTQIVSTRHFRIISEPMLGHAQFARFAKVVESVPELIRGHPMPLWAPRGEGPIDIILCRNEESFVEAGGRAGAVGWWDGRRARALIRADYFLAPPRPENARLQPRPDQDLLVHELVHMSMAGLLERIPPWFSEGVAEYFAVCHQGAGWYLFRDLESLIRDHLRWAVSRNKVADTYHLVPVGKILSLDHPGWIETAQNQFEGNAYRPYATALLLAHYHFHGGVARRVQVATHLKNIRELSPLSPIPAFPTEKAAEIESRLVKYWSARGLKLAFGD